MYCSAQPCLASCQSLAYLLGFVPWCGACHLTAPAFFKSLINSIEERCDAVIKAKETLDYVFISSLRCFLKLKNQ